MPRAIGAVAALSALVVLAVLSWMPPGSLVRTGLLPGQAEHVVAYLAATFVIAVCFARRLRPHQVMLAMVVYACILELGQISVPGRHAAIGDALASVTGVLLGFAAYATSKWCRSPILDQFTF